MRELKFRGINANGKMVYGMLVKDIPDSTFYYDEYPNRICWDEGTAHCNMPVKKDTEGQFTGLLDKNGNEIYEGDLLKDSTGVSSVTWNEKFSSFCLTRRGWLSNHFFGEAADPEDCEVIGNVHQNIEILK
jgi:hypothetical protein